MPIANVVTRKGALDAAQSAIRLRLHTLTTWLEAPPPPTNCEIPNLYLKQRLNTAHEVKKLTAALRMIEETRLPGDRNNPAPAT